MLICDDVRQVYTEILCRGSVYVSSFTVSELTDQLRVELRPSASTALDHLIRLGLLIYAGAPDRYMLPSAVRLVARYVVSWRQNEHTFTELLFRGAGNPGQGVS